MAETPKDNTQPTGGSLTFSASQRFVRPMQREVTALINAYHQANADQDDEARARLRESILARLDDFDATSGDGHAYPDWIRPVLRANAHSAFGDLDEAIRLDLEGAEHAQLDMHRAISANNLSDHYRRRGDLDEAIRHAARAHDLWPENEGVIVNLALALDTLDLLERRGPGVKISRDRVAARLEDITARVEQGRRVWPVAASDGHGRAAG